MQSFRPRELLSGSVNADGFGVGWYHEGRPVRIRDERPIWQADDLEGLLSSVTSPLVLALLRNVTPGIPVERAGISPLLFERWSFGLNGFLGDFRRTLMRRMHGMLPPALHERLTGVSDTEALFLLSVGLLREGATPAEALAEVVRVALRESAAVGVDSQLNMVLSDGEEVVLTRSGTSERSNSLYVIREGSLAPFGVMAASERLDDDERWESVPEQSMVRLTVGGGVTVTPL